MKLFLCLAAIASSLCAEEKWVQQYAYGDNDGQMVLTDLKFPSARRGIACGVVNRHISSAIFGDRETEQPFVLITSDGGQKWTRIPTKEVGLRLFFLDDSTGWMITSAGLWKTEESGRSWKRQAIYKELEDVYFRDHDHGFLVGAEKQAYSTTDGGANWTPIDEAAKPATTKQWTVYSSIAFAGKAGIITGWSRRPNPVDYMRPAWRFPESAENRREQPRVTIFLDTFDEGATWKAASASLMGELSKVSLSPDGFGLGLFEFHDNFPWPAEVYRLDTETGSSTRVFRDKDRAITDVLIVPGGDSFLAGYEPPTAIRPSPLPGKVKILRSRGTEPWIDMKVDYRAVARHVFLASPGGDQVWAGLDSGIILKLATE